MYVCGPPQALLPTAVKLHSSGSVHVSEFAKACISFIKSSNSWRSTAFNLDSDLSQANRNGIAINSIGSNLFIILLFLFIYTYNGWQYIMLQCKSKRHSFYRMPFIKSAFQIRITEISLRLLYAHFQ